MSWTINNNVANTTITENDNVNGVIKVSANTGWEFDTYYGIANSYYIGMQLDGILWNKFPPTDYTATELIFANLPTTYNGTVRFRAYHPLVPAATPQPTYTLTNNITGTTANYTLANNEFTINVIGTNNKYRFDGTPTITYTDANGIRKTVNTTVSFVDGVSTASVIISDADVTNDIEFIISGVYSLFVDIVNNINGVNLTYTPYTNELDIYLNGTLQGYKFTSAPTATYIDINGNTQTAYFNRTDGNTKAVIYLTNVDTAQTVTINGIYELVVNIVNNITDTVASYSIENNIITLIVRGTLYHYRFTNTPTVTYTDNQNSQKTEILSVVLDTVTSTASINLNDAKLTENFVLNGVYERVLDVVNEISNCVIVGVPEYVTKSTNVTITATANEYCKFTITPSLRYYKNSLFANVPFVLNVNSTVATATINLSEFADHFSEMTQLTISANAVVNTEYINKYGAINVYCVTTENLDDFAKKRFFQLNTETTPTSIDLGNYVTSLKRLYIDLSSVPLLPNVLRCANFNTEINVLTPLFDVLTLDCGYVEIPQYNGNVADLNSEIQIFLPFVGMVNINANLVGKTLNVNYIVNIISTNAIVNIICDNVIIDQYECNISSGLLYRTADTDRTAKIEGTLSFNDHVLKGLTPYVVCKHFADANEKIYNNDCKRGSISSFNGFIQCTEIGEINKNLPTEIINLINEQLENGVYV